MTEQVQTNLLLADEASVILNNREDRLENRAIGYSYKLMDGGGQYGFDAAFSERSDIDEKRMSLWIPIADGNTRDGVGDTVEVEGIRTERHRVNPIVLSDHGKGHHAFAAWPIAKAEDRDTGEYTFQADPVARTAGLNAFFYQGKGMPSVDRKDEYEFATYCEQLYDLAAKRYIRGGSIGYSVIHAKSLQPDYERGIPAGLHLLSVLMLEGSLVVLPANQWTVAKMLALPRICGKPLSPYLVKSLTPYAPPKKAQLGYEPRQTKSHSSIENQLAKIGKESENPDTIGYGNVFWNPEKKEVWYVVGDWAETKYDEDPTVKKLAAVSGVVKVTREAEAFPPKDKGWIQLHPKRRDWVKSLERKTKSQIAGDLDWLKEEESEVEHKSVLVPLASLSNKPNPPSHWKPGLGAIKDLRLKHRKKRIGEQVEIAPMKEGGWTVAKAGTNQPVESGLKFSDIKTARIWARNLGYYVVGVVGITEGRKDMPSNHIPPTKACQILKDGTANGKPLSEAQRGMFGAACGDKKGLKADCKCQGNGSCKCEMGKNKIKSIRVQYRKNGGSQLSSATQSASSDHTLADRTLPNHTEPNPTKPYGLKPVSSGSKSIIPNAKEKSIKVRHGLSRVIKGFSEVQLKFDLGGLPIDEQNAFLIEMGQAGFGLPGQGRLISTSPPKLTAPLRLATFTYDVSPGASGAPDVNDVSESIREATTIASKHGVRFLGSTGGKSMSKMKTKALITEDEVRGAYYQSIQGLLADRGIEAQVVPGPVGFKCEVRSLSPVAQVAEVLKQAGYIVDTTATKVWIKSLNKQGNKHMPSTLNRKTKDLPPEETVEETEKIESNGDEMVEEKVEEPAEKYGAQALRRIHQDHGLLMEEYNGFLEHLEEPQVKEHIEELLGEIDERMSKVEELFGSIDEYKSYDKLEGASEPEEETKDMDENAEEQTEGDSETPEETPPEEVVEGMKSMDVEKVKQLRGQWKRKGNLGVEGNQTPGNEEFDKKPGKQGSNGKLGVEGSHNPGFEEFQKKPGTQGKQFPEAEKEDAEVDVTKKGFPEESNMDDRSEVQHPDTKGLMPHHRKAIGEASDYARELSEENDFGEEHRKKSYFHHKMLDNIAEDFSGSDYGVEGHHEPGMESMHQKDMPVENADNEANVQHPCYKVLKDASRHFKALSDERAFGEEHRKACLLAHKALEPFGKEDERAEVTEGNTDDIVPGEMGEKALLPLKAKLDQRTKMMDDLNEKMNRLLKAIS